MKEKHYELTGNCLFIDDEKLYQIKATLEIRFLSITVIEACQLGGFVAENVSIGDYSWVQKGAIVHKGAVIGQLARIGFGATIGEDAKIGVGARIGFGAIIGVNAIIGKDC